MNTATDINPTLAEEAGACLHACSEAFGQLAALLAAIREQAPGHSIIAKLATLGCTVANDAEDYADATREQLQNNPPEMTARARTAAPQPPSPSS